MGSTAAWADVATIDGTNLDITGGAKTVSHIELSVPATDGFVYNNGLYASSSNRFFILTPKDGVNIKTVLLTMDGTSNRFNKDNITNCTSATRDGSVYTCSISDGTGALSFKNDGGGVKITKLEVTYTSAGPTTTTLTVSPNSGSVYVGKTLDISGYVSTNSNATKTYTSSNESVATVTSAGVISGVAAGSTTITVAQDANASYTAANATFSITVNAAPTQYTVTLASSPAAGGSVSGKYNTADAYNGKAINNDFSSGDKVSENTRLTLTASPNTGYQFANSWGGSSATTATFTTATTTSNKTYTANFSAMTYTVTIDENTGTAGDATVTATYDAALPSFNAPTKAGNTLSGYYTETSGGTKVINANGTLVTGVAGYTDGSGNWKYDGNVTLHAQWEAAAGSSNTYYYGCMTLTNGALTKGSVSSSPLFVKAGASLASTSDISISSSAPATTDYYYESNDLGSSALATSSNWKTSSSSNKYIRGLKFKSGDSYTLALGSKTATSITFYGKNGSASKTLTIGDQTFTTSSTKNTHFSHSFTRGGNFTGNVTITQDGDMYGILVVEISSGSATYSVTYDANGGTGTTTDSSSPYALNATVTVQSNGFSKTGYTFAGWNSKADGTGTNFAASSTFTITKDTTLYAKWTPVTYAITLDKNGGATDGSVTATYNSSALTDYSAALKAGSTLKGYYTATSAGNKVIDEEGNLVANVSGYTDASGKWIKTDVATPTLYAQWETVYTVTFDATTNGGTCATASLTQASAGADIVLPAATKDGNTFDGWYTAYSGGTKAGDAGDSWGDDELTANTTLYAQFTPVVATTKFHFVAETSETTFTTSGEEEITTSNKATTLDYGHLWYNSNGSSRDRKYGLKLGGNAEYIKIVLNEALAIGDVITFDQGTGSNQISFTTTATRSTTPATSENTYTVTSTDGLADENTIYVWRASGSTTYVNEITITTSGEAATYAVSFEMGGIADDIEQLTEQTTLPNPLPTPTNVTDGYTFEGWYTNSSFTTAATAGAALAANTTLYANYIINTPTISQNGGSIYTNTDMSLTGDVPFTQVYAQWKGDDGAFDKATAVADPEHYRTYNSTAVDTYNFKCATASTGTRYFSYMICDGKFYSVPAVTAAFSVSHLITISAQPQNQVFTVGATATNALEVTASVSNEATPTYQWQQCNTEDGTFENIALSGTSRQYTPNTSSPGTTYYRCKITYSGAADVCTDVVSVTVNTAAAFTVSFDKGIGCSTEIIDRTETKSGAGITLPSVTVSSADRYQFDGWYLENTKVGVADDTYHPSGSVTLTAKYKCKVTLTKNESGEGNLPTAKIKSSGAEIESGDFVLEGTTITLTASPAANFTEWGVGTSGTTNPKDFVLNDYKEFKANYIVPAYKTLFHTTFPSSETGWSSVSGVKGGGTATGVGDDTYKPHNVTLETSESYSYTWTDGKLTVPQNYGSENYIAIPVKGVNGELTITVANSSSKTQFKYSVVLGSSTTSPGSGTATTKAAPSTTTVTGLAASNYVVYIGRTGDSYKNFTEITITTPNVSLTADSAQVRIMGTGEAKRVTVGVTTSSDVGTISIKNNPTSSIATASYSAGTLTITPVAAGTTSVVLQLKNGDETLRELTIPITVQVPTITINTQPSNVVCYQNDATEKTMSVVATVNTGNELTYQWYRNTAASTTGPTLTAIPGATSATYTLNTFDKATTGTNYYYFCRVTSADDDLTLDTEVKSVTVSALTAGTYNANVFVGSKGGTLTYTGLGGETIISSDTDTSHTYYSASISSGTLTIKGNSVGTGTITLSNSVIINVTVKRHTVQLIWSAEKAEYDVTDWSANRALTIDDGSHPENLPYLTRLYEDGTPYTGTVTFYIDDTSMAYFNSPGTGSYTQTAGVKPNIYYAGGQGGCKFYAYIGSGDEVESVKASYDLRLKKGYSNDLPSGRKVEVQQQYTMYIPDTDTKLITVTYGGYKYNDHKWDGKADSWGSATNYVGKDNAIDGYLYAVRNKDRDAKDEYKHAVQDDGYFGESAWYASGQGGTTREYQRIKPFRLPCRASYVTFTAHKTGTLTAYVYQNGIIGRGTGAGNQLASAPRLGYWFDEEGWVQEPSATVVTKQVIQKGNARNQRSYGGYTNLNEQMDGKAMDGTETGKTGYWTNEADQIVIKKLRSKWCEVEKPNKDTPASSFSDAADMPDGWYNNPYYWGTQTEVEDNLAKVLPTPEHPIPHQGGHMIVNEGYVKYTINVVAGHTYYFFGKMTKVGYAGMNFVPAEETDGAYTTTGFTNYCHETTRLDLNSNDNWTTLFGASGTALKNTKTTVYDTVTLPSNYRAGKWNTICLPFAVNENQLEQVFGKGTELAIFNGLLHDTENHVYYIKYLRHVDQNILPGQPYLILPTGRAVAERSNQENGGMAETGEDIPTVGTTDKIIGSTSTGGSGTRIVFKNVIINKGITAQSYGSDVDADGTTTSYVFKGTDAQGTIRKYDIYNTPKTGALKRYMPDPDNTMTLNTYHAWAQANDEDIKQDAITFAFAEDDVIRAWDAALIDRVDPDDPQQQVTGVENDGIRERNAKNIGNGKAYNLMGQEIDSTSAKGMVIVNGKKYIK